MNTYNSFLKFDLIPVAKPRQTQADRWKQRPVVMRYRKFADEIREIASNNNFILSRSISVQFCMPMPGSWSKKKRLLRDGMPHDVRPDLDNLIKAVCDALMEEDKYLYRITASKHWSLTGGILIHNL